MRALLALLLIAAAPAPRDDFVQRLAAAIRKADPSATVTVTDPRTLTIKRKGHDDGKIYTDSIDRFCEANSAGDCEVERAAFIRNTAAAATTDYETLSPAQLRVVVRGDDYVASYRAALDQGKKGVLVTRPVAPVVTAMLAADFPTTTRMVSTSDLDPLGLTIETAMALGEKQTVADLPPVPKLADIKGKLIALAGFDYGASLMLMPERWHDLADASGGTLFVAIPSDDNVLVGTATRAELSALRTMVADSMAHARRGVSPLVYRWSPTGWVVAE
ncbi:hypothetical protein U1839_03795 [Sphingomonas sp. RT2P30]|uniref:hypothetical protein n=1 Tax=Parasphingomonas halimpatiens TaxID=3096162 RepID=UPI002FC94794